MSLQTYLPEETIVRQGIAALMAALGPVETARFLALPHSRLSDYVEWHRQWQAGLDTQTFLDELFGAQQDANQPSEG